MAFSEGLNEVAQALDEVVAHLLPTNPNQVSIQQEPAQDPLPYLIYNLESEPDSDIELDPDLLWREVQDIPSFQLREAIRNPQPTENDSFPLQNDTPLLTLLTMMMGMDCKVIELVVFHPMDQIHNSISSWILTTTIDFDPYKDALFSINQYALKVKQSFTRYSESFQSDDLRYSLLLNMTMDDINSVLHEITLTQIEMLNLIDNVHRPKDIRTKRSLLHFGRYIISCSGLQKMRMSNQ